MLRSARFLVAAVALLSACGGGSKEDTSGVGGLGSGGAAAGTGGDSSSGGLASSGGKSAAGGQATIGGNGGGGGTVSGGAGSGGASAECPLVPRSRVFPLVGPFFMGPDPGPCQRTDTQGTGTYVYEAGLVVSYDQGETYERDSEGRIISVDYNGVVATETYLESSIVETQDGSTVTYQLDSRGYPQTAALDQTSDGTTDYTWQYVYEDCRLVRRIAPTDFDGGVDRVYSYDAAGHVISFADGATVTTFDYSCW